MIMKNYNKKILIFIIIFVFTAGFFSACTKISNEIIVMFDIEDKGRYDEFIANFEKNNIDIKIKAVYGQDVTKLVGTSNEPDLIKTGNVSIESDKNMLTDLNPYIEKYKDLQKTDFNPILIDTLTVDGALYGLPTAINTSLLYYNKDLFDASADELRIALRLSASQSVYPAAGWTYDDFQKAGVVLTKYQISSGIKIYSQYGAETQSLWWGEWLVYVRQFGGDFYEAGNNHKSALNSEAALKGTTFLYNKCLGDDSMKFAPKTLDNELSFAGGKVAMIFGGHIGDWPSYNALDLNWDIQILPTPVEFPDAKGGEISADAYGISARSNKKDKAYKFLSYWVSEEGAAIQFKFGRIGALNNMQSIVADFNAANPELTGKNPQNINAVFTAAGVAIPLPREKDFKLVCTQYVMDKIQIMLQGEEGYTPLKAMENAFKSVNNYYKNLYGE